MANALVSIQIIPRTKGGEDPIPFIDRAIELIINSGLSYRVGPLETTIEGELAECLDVVRRMNEQMIELGCLNVISQVKIYYHPQGASMSELTKKYDSHA